jgi:hypothetical protein
MADIWYSIFNNYFFGQHFDKMLEFEFNFKINSLKETLNIIDVKF